MNLRAVFRYFFLIVLGVALSMTTFIFGALPMRTLRLSYGRLTFWMGFALAAAGIAVLGLPAYALAIFSLVVLVGVYTDLEEHGSSVFTAGIISLASSVFTTVLCGGLWLQRSKISIAGEVRSAIGLFEESARRGGSKLAIEIEPETIIQQLPSIAIIGLMVALAITLIAEGRMLVWAGRSKEVSAALLAKLSAFRVPDLFIWTTIVAVFGAFVKHGNHAFETIAVNVLNVLIVLFFFQGLAVVSQAFRVFKVTPFWRGLWYIVFVFQLFLLVSLVGFVDFWIEFRERLTRKPATTNKGF